MMDHVIELIKVIFLGIVEGITEWLPISSTGHMLLVDEFIQMNITQEFKDMFLVVIQLGAILAVVILFWEKMWPFQRKTATQPAVRWDTIQMWLKVVVACIPGAVVTILFDDYIEAHLHTPVVIAAALIVYGIAFILIENWNKKRTPKVNTLGEITYRTAFLIGLFQVLSIIPGTSRSGSTIIGALLIGVSRVAAAEFTFFLAVPVMVTIWVCLTPKKLRKTHIALFRKAKTQTNEYMFRDKDFRISGIQSSSVYPYFQITNLGESQHYFFLYFGEDMAYYVAKDGFTQGTEEEFRKFIQKRTEKKRI